MPYYCTVPRCTSMAGKAKNVSFHQFPRDEELAKLWNRILKRGKPYTKYSKVCSLHFKPEDYTITSVGKNKGQWRTLRKDAVPSQNLPSDSPVPYTPRRHSSAWVPSLSPNIADPMVQQQMAQAIYMQTMLAMQAAGASETLASNDQPSQSEIPNPSPSSSSLSEIELLLRCKTETEQKDETYQCQECSKCFKDPDVFILHKRIHTKDIIEKLPLEKENFSANIQQQETLRANPILANLLKSSMRLEQDNINPHMLEANVLSVENQIMTALASNMEAYIRTLSSMLANQSNRTESTGDLSENKCEGEDTGDCAGENYSGNEGGDGVYNEYKSSEVNKYSVEEENGEYEDKDIKDSVIGNECRESNECKNECSDNGGDMHGEYEDKDIKDSVVGNECRESNECKNECDMHSDDTYQQRVVGLVHDFSVSEASNHQNDGDNCENDQERPDCDSIVDINFKQ